MTDLACRLRGMWEESIGFSPKVIASFDHMSAGIDSRIIIGYENLRYVWRRMQDDEGRRIKGQEFEPLLSLVNDTVLPERERYGVGAELGILNGEANRVVTHSNVFYFRNRFHYDFASWLPAFSDAAEKLFSNQKRKVSEPAIRKMIGGFDLIRRHFSHVETCAEMIEARNLLSRTINRGRFKGKKMLWSEALPIVARVLEEAAKTLDFNTCPGVENVGLARLVTKSGNEDQLIREWDPALVELIARKEAIPTGPLDIFASSLLYPHYGNDYGMLPKLAAWSGIEARIVAGDGKNGWPAGHIIFARGGGSRVRMHSVFSDLLFFHAEEYGEKVKAAVDTGGPSFELSAG